MNNNKMLLLMKNALDLDNDKIGEIFKLGEVTLTQEVIKNMLIIPEKDGAIIINDAIQCEDSQMESFLNGFIVYKRGYNKDADGNIIKAASIVTDRRSVNNVFMKKIKIALQLTADDVIDIYESIGVFLSKGEISPWYRKEGHKHYKRCTDERVVDFLEGVDSIKGF